MRRNIHAAGANVRALDADALFEQHPHPRRERWRVNMPSLALVPRATFSETSGIIRTYFYDSIGQVESRRNIAKTRRDCVNGRDARQQICASNLQTGARRIEREQQVNTPHQFKGLYRCSQIVGPSTVFHSRLDSGWPPTTPARPPSKAAQIR